jgi:hypothetical protein
MSAAKSRRTQMATTRVCRRQISTITAPPRESTVLPPAPPPGKCRGLSVPSNARSRRSDQCRGPRQSPFGLPRRARPKSGSHQASQIKIIDKDIDRLDRIILRQIVFQALRKQSALTAVFERQSASSNPPAKSPENHIILGFSESTDRLDQAARLNASRAA